MPKVKGFYYCYDGDQIRVIFDADEEKRAFSSAIDIVHRGIAKMGGFDKVNEAEIVLETTLQKVVISDHIHDFRKIFNVAVINAFGGEKSVHVLLKFRNELDK